MIELLEPRPPASPEDMAAAEKRLAELGHHLPPSYKAFLAEHDGGEPVKDRFTFEIEGRTAASRVQEFLGVAPVPAPGANLVMTAAIVTNRVPAGVLPIAPDEVGNLVCLDGREGRDGPVLFWDHEYEGDPPDEVNLYEIAPNLQTFIDGLIEKPNPPRVHPKPRGLRRLFGGR
jgi:cell wall assembly regulator SMI1